MLCIHFDNIINIITGIGTMTASLIALFTLFELKRQRKESNRSEPFVKSTFVFIYGLKAGEYYFPFCYSPKKLDEEKIQDYSLTDWDFNLELVNVGFRSAKNIILNWNFSFKKAIDLIEKYNKDGLFKINLDDKVLDIIFVKSGYSQTDLFINQMNKQLFDFLLNSTSESFHSISLRFPIVVLELYSIYLCLIFGYYKNEKSIMRKFDIPDFPVLKLLLQYKDIAGVQYSKNFNLNITCSSFSNPMITQLKEKIGAYEIKVAEAPS